MVAGRCTPKHDNARGAHTVFLYLFWIEMVECRAPSESRILDSTLQSGPFVLTFYRNLSRITDARTASTLSK